MTTDNTQAKQAAMVALQKINAVEGFDPSALAVEYTDLNSAGGKETRLRLPVMAQIGWFRLKYPEGRIAVSVTTGKDCFVATARVYPHYSAPVDQFLAEATASRGYIWPTSPLSLPGSGRRPPRWGLPCAMRVLDSSSVRLATPLTRRP